MPSETYVLRVWLPDRPGVLGQVASRIGAVHGDVIGIEILERGGGSAIDELTITLPDADLVELLIDEVREVDGVAVEDIRRIAAERPDATVAALDVAADVVAATPVDRLDVCCQRLLALFDADWAIAYGARRQAALASAGEVPAGKWLGAFLDGAGHLETAAHRAPSDVAWSWLEHAGIALACGRAGRPFHSRERQQLAVLARLLESLRSDGGDR